MSMAKKVTVHVTLNSFAFHICLWLLLAAMGAWRTSLSPWNKTDSGHEVRRWMCSLERKSFLDKVPKLDRGWTVCCKAMSKEPALACVLFSPPPPPDALRPNNQISKSLSSIWIRSQPSQLHKEACFAVSLPEMKYRKIGLKCGHISSLLLSPSCCEIHSWLSWNHVLVTNNLPSLHKFAVHSLQGNIVDSWFTAFFPLKGRVGSIKRCAQGQCFKM